MDVSTNAHFTVDTTVETQYLRITARGEYRFEELFDFIGLIKAMAEETARNRVLIDCSQVRGNMMESERFSGGQKIAEVFGSRLKAALIMQSSQVTKLGELAAVNRGARFKVTDNETDALKWLLD